MRKTRGMAGLVTLISLILLLLSLPAVIAASEVDVRTIDDHILFGEKASFQITIKNLRDERQVYEISSTASGIEWGVQTRPLDDKIFTLLAGSQRTVNITVEPVENFPAGVYVINLLVITDLNEKYEKALKVFIGPNEPREYLPSIRTRVDMDDRIDPRETQSLKLFLENLNPLDLTNMTIRTTNEIKELNMEQTLDLEPGPGSKKTVEFTFKLPETLQPKDYFIFFQFIKDGEILKVEEKRFEVIPLTPEFTMEVKQTDKFLRNDYLVAFTNNGNVKNTQVVAFEVGILNRLFTISSLDTKAGGEHGIGELAWEIELNPGESTEIIVKTSYRIPLVIFILLAAGLLLYRFYRNPLALTKSASNVVLHHGSVSGLKVTLVVRNLGESALKDIEVRDSIPGIADVDKGVEMGSMKPSRILRGKRGSTIVLWKFSEIEGKEERLITYNIKSRLNVVGTFQLPRAKATFAVKSGRRSTSYSNTYRISTGE